MKFEDYFDRTTPRTCQRCGCTKTFPRPGTTHYAYPEYDQAARGSVRRFRKSRRCWRRGHRWAVTHG